MGDKLVYSSGHGDLRETVKKHKKAGKEEATGLPSGIKNDGIVRIRRESKGRGGKTVCCIYGLPLRGKELDTLGKELKQKCGTGGTIKDGIIIIQGDKSGELMKLLTNRGYTVKLTGS